MTNPAAYLIGSESDAGGLTTTTITVGSNSGTANAAGDTILIIPTANSASATIASITDTLGQTYTAVESASGTANDTFVWAVQNAAVLAAGATIVVTWTGGTSIAKGAMAIGVNGVLAASLDTAAAVAQGTSAAPSVTSGALAQAGEIVVAIATTTSSDGVITWGAGWTPLTTIHPQEYVSAATQLVTAQTAVTASGTTTASGTWAAFIIPLKASGTVVVSTAITLANSYEEGTSGVTVTTSDSAGTGQNAFDQVNGVSGGGTVAFDNTYAAHGSLSCKIVTASGGSLASCRWSTQMGSQTGPVWARANVYLTAYPTLLNRLISYQTSGGVNCATAHINTNGTINIRDANGVAVLTSTTVVPLNKWWRLEIFITGGASTGQCGFRLYTSNLDEAASTPDETQTSTAAQSFTGTPGFYDFGVSVSTAAAAYWMDDVALSNVNWIGPAGTPVSVGAGLLTLQPVLLAAGGGSPANLTAALASLAAYSGVLFANTGREVLAVSVGATPTTPTSDIGTTVLGQAAPGVSGGQLATSAVAVLGPWPAPYDRQDGTRDVEVDFSATSGVSAALLRLPGVL